MATGSSAQFGSGQQPKADVLPRVPTSLSRDPHTP